MLVSEMPGLMKDVDSKKLSMMTKYSYETRKEFDAMRDKSLLSWCIVAVPTKLWAKTLFPNSLDAVSDLWMEIFRICNID